MAEQRRQQRIYDHRLKELVRQTGNLTIATRLGVPRSTAAGWLRSQTQDVITLDVLELREKQLQAEVLKLRRRMVAHNGQIPHSAFRGQTPDEMYLGTGEQVPRKLAAANEAARAARLHVNRALGCEVCGQSNIAIRAPGGVAA